MDRHWAGEGRGPSALGLLLTTTQGVALGYGWHAPLVLGSASQLRMANGANSSNRLSAKWANEFWNLYVEPLFFFAGMG